VEVMQRRVAGLDVHKETVVACVRVTAGRRPTRDCRTFTTTTQGLPPLELLVELLGWLTASRVTHVAMEATRRVLDAGVEDPERG
jgi:transposase